MWHTRGGCIEMRMWSKGTFVDVVEGFRMANEY